ncbi:HGGxSTG domain-containing protein [Streptomyces sp. NPDC093272]|uniref:HGGxSTG domain-containing protein n=1 Tax=Streptomyces sp. NPDC093272 TaxID=3154981 RepID=UPI00343CB921
MGGKSRARELPEGFEEFRPDGKPRCWGRSKSRSGAQCPNPSMKGQHVCRYHGGLAPQALKAAEGRIMEAKVRQLVTTYGLKIETTPTQALLDEVQWTAGHVAWLRERVQEIESAAVAQGTDGEHPLVWGVTRQKTGGEDAGTTEEAAPSVWLKLYQAERAHLVKVCSEALRAGIEERRVKLAESQGALVAHAIRAILADLGLSDEQQARVTEVVPRHLRALASA